MWSVWQRKRKHDPYPACRPKAVAGKISKQEAKKKTGPKAVKWSVTASGRRRKKAAEGGMIPSEVEEQNGMKYDSYMSL